MSIPEKELEEVAALMRKQFEESQSPEAKAKQEEMKEAEYQRKLKIVDALVESTLCGIVLNLPEERDNELIRLSVRTGIIAAIQEYGIKI